MHEILIVGWPVKGLLSRPGVSNALFGIPDLEPHIASSQYRETLNITISQIKLLSLICCSLLLVLYSVCL